MCKVEPTSREWCVWWWVWGGGVEVCVEVFDNYQLEPPAAGAIQRAFQKLSNPTVQ